MFLIHDLIPTQEQFLFSQKLQKYSTEWKSSEKSSWAELQRTEQLQMYILVHPEC